MRCCWQKQQGCTQYYQGKCDEKVQYVIDMGDVPQVLGIQVTRDSQAGSLAITQEDNTSRRLVKYGMQYCRPLGALEHGK